MSKRILGIGALVAAVGLWLPAARARSATWDGPACKVGAANFAVCSGEPPVAEDWEPCYVSHFANYQPNQIELDLIKLCQAAKVASAAPKSERDQTLSAVSAAGLELSADVSDDPDVASYDADAVRSAGKDLVVFGQRVMAYSEAPTPETWQRISDSLADITSDAQVWGGGG